MPVDDPYRVKRQVLVQRVLAGPGVLSPADRQAAYDGTGPDGPAGVYARQVHADATRIGDDSVAALRSDLSEEAIFELTIAAATGAGMRRLDHLLALLEDA